MAEDKALAQTAYCMKCKAKRAIEDPQAIYNRAGAPATRGHCGECGTKLYRMGRTPAHANIPKPEKITRPPRKKKPTKSKAKAKAKSRAKNSKVPKNVGKLVIVESPAKARSIGGFLGKGYTVMSSRGHVRDLLKSRLSVDVEHDFTPEYRVPNDKRAVVKELKAAVQGAEEIFLATDPDREGEAIAWHLVAAAEMPADLTRRVVFHEITDSAVAAAFAQPRDINLALVNAQQARRILDRLVGYKVSALLWKKVRNGLSAGRVQSIALRLVVEREKEIENFRPVEYWTVEASLAKSGNHDSAAFKARLVKIGDTNVTFEAKSGKAPVLDSEATVQPHIDILRRSLFIVDSIKRGSRQSRPAPPFTTSTLQQAASSRRGFRARRTMQIAQQLYEGIDIGQGKSIGLITYMRTDSVQVSAQAQSQTRAYIKDKYGPAYLPKSPPKYKTKAKAAQEAHEAIRPTSIERSPDSLKAHLSAPQLQLYTLIWQRFVASQMAPAVYDTLRIEVKAGLHRSDLPYLFRAAGSRLKFAGHLVVSDKTAERGKSASANGPEQIFPELEAGEKLSQKQILPEQHFTQPPPRYTEATLIRQLEENGIGRPSTYAPTVSIIQTRDYVTQEARRLKPTKTGVVVSDLLAQYFEVEMDYAFTAKMEDQLDEISEGNRQWQPMLAEFYQPFEQRLQNAQANMPKLDMAERVGRACPTCGAGELLVKHSRYGKFIGCSNYPNCRHTEKYLERTGYLCPQCGSTEGGEIVERRSRKGRLFFGCSRYPDCDFSAWRLPKGLVKQEAQATGKPTTAPPLVKDKASAPVKDEELLPVKDKAPPLIKEKAR